MIAAQMRVNLQRRLIRNQRDGIDAEQCSIMEVKEECCKKRASNTVRSF